jgi:hypothetical protein
MLAISTASSPSPMPYSPRRRDGPQTSKLKFSACKWQFAFRPMLSSRSQRRPVAAINVRTPQASTPCHSALSRQPAGCSSRANRKRPRRRRAVASLQRLVRASRRNTTITHAAAEAGESNQPHSSTAATSPSSSCWSRRTPNRLPRSRMLIATPPSISIDVYPVIARRHELRPILKFRARREDAGRPARP